MKLFARAISMSLIVTGASCGKRDGTPGAGSATAGSAIAAGSAGSAMGAGSDRAASPAGSAAAGSAAMSLQTAVGRYGILLAEAAGGTVTVTLDGGTTEQLADLTLVTVIGDAGASKQVEVGGKHGTVKLDRVVFDEDIQRSPKGDFAVVTPLLDCEDMCSKAAWLVHGAVKRWLALEVATSPVAAWHPDGTKVAIGGGEKFVVIALPSGEVLEETRGYVAPAYAPDGTLYVRDDNYSVFRFVDGEATRVGKRKKPTPLEGEYAVDPKPVTFGPDGTFKTID